MNIESVDVHPKQVCDIINSEKKLIYEIPKYQREYVWGLTEWETMFDDLQDNDNGYYLGSIICINANKDPYSDNKLEVIDGQQRLTTISLYFAALYNSLKEFKSILDEDQNQDLLNLKRKIILKDSGESATRVIPQTQGNNLDDYKFLLKEVELLKNDCIKMPKYFRNRKIYKAYSYFKKRIDRELEKIEQETRNLDINEEKQDEIVKQNKIKTILSLKDKLNEAIVVSITVTKHSDAYTLFESLNNRGKPLTPIDLIKNNFLACVSRKNNTNNFDEYFEKWKIVLENLCDDYATQERFFRQNYNAFKHILDKNFSSPLAPIATKSNLIKIYEELVSNKPDKFIDEILENSKIYSRIICNAEIEEDFTIDEKLKDLQHISGAPSYLLLLYLFKYKENLNLKDENLEEIIELLTSFFVRRNLTDIPATRDLTRLFMGFIIKINKDNLKNNAITTYIRSELINKSASDKYFEEKLRGPIFADNDGTTRFILCKFAELHKTKENQPDLWARNKKSYVWTIEHIFPQGENIPKVWIDMIANGDKEKAKEYQNQYVHCLGNLTISAYNSNLGNMAFEEKKERKDSKGNYIGYKNGLSLNKDVVDKSIWTIKEITERRDKLVADALKVFDLTK